MVDDAQRFEAEDKARREAIDARNQLDSLTYNTQKLVDDNRDKLPEAERVAVEEELRKAKEVLERNKDASDAAPLRQAIEDLQKSAHKLAEVMYRQAGPGAAPNGEGGEGAEAGEAAANADRAKAGKDVIDAEFEESK
jgi:molecular chaperone DnaK